MAESASPAEASLEIRVVGIVQGVGFRPFVHRLALRWGLRGWVRNDSGAVTIRVGGVGNEVDQFLRGLTEERPPLARIDGIETREVEPLGPGGFRILSSEMEGEGSLPVPPDVGICNQCLDDLRHRGNRRYHYPFTTCTDCGPRFTIIQGMPYDRERTSMEAFRQCRRCEVEYTDPADRRHHSETNSCPECGPRIWYEAATGAAPGSEGGQTASPYREGVGVREGSGGGMDDLVTEGTEEALARAAELILAGGILALRGLGGFQLIVDAGNDEAVRRLRSRKGREGKPFAVMVADLEAARRCGVVGEAEERVLTSPESPIVLLDSTSGGGITSTVAPGLDSVGVMIPYTPLHHLLLQKVDRPLVMTSGNVSEEPIAAGVEEARGRLGGIADGFLLHDREIVTRVDDSVVRVVHGAPLLLRRARGYAPVPVSLPVPSPLPLLAVGPHLKNTFALVEGDQAYLSQHLGDLEDVETMDLFRETLDRFRHLFRIRPRAIVRDLHPGYLSTRLADDVAQELGCGEPFAVQHHHAHVAAVLGEYGEVAPVVGVAYDGTGYGEDGRVWGAEVLEADLEGYRRLAHLRYAPLPGGEAAVRNPWRTAAGYLALEPDRAEDFREAFRGVGARERAVATTQAVRGVNAPLASSMGRLFDAAAAVLGHRRECSYEGQAAMEMEALARGGNGDPGGGPGLPFPWVKESGGMVIMDPLPLLSELGRRRLAGEDAGLLAHSFHRAVIRTTREVVLEACAETGRDTVVLSGGVFQNRLLTEGLGESLERAGLRVLLPRALSPNDGSISYGQAAVASACLAKEA
jgi:hydrogenase maturation protein HypF